jgi:hypothetical protein
MAMKGWKTHSSPCNSSPIIWKEKREFSGGSSHSSFATHSLAQDDADDADDDAPRISISIAVVKQCCFCIGKFYLKNPPFLSFGILLRPHSRFAY